MRRENELFETASIPGAVLALSVPTMMGMALTVVYGMADMIFVGMTGDASQITVTALLSPAAMVVMAMGGIFGIGGASCISRQLGLRQRKLAAQTCSFCFYATLLAGLFCTWLGLLLLPEILAVLGGTGEIFPLATAYGRIVFWGTTPAALSFAMNQMIRARGAAGKSMNGMLLGAALNLILDPILILGVGWGACGAAAASLIADCCCLAYYLSVLLRDEILSIRLADFSVNRCVMGGVLAVGLPACLANFTICISETLFNRLALAHGDHVVAAFSVASRVLMISNMVVMGMAKGAQPLIGYSFAAGNWKRMRGTVRFACGLGTAICLGFAGVVYFRSGGLIQIFTNDPDVVWLGTVILDAMVIAIPTAGMEAVLLSTFQAMGKSAALLLLSVGRQALICIPLMFLMDHRLGLSGLILYQPAKEYVTIVMAAVLYGKYVGKEKPYRG